MPKTTKSKVQKHLEDILDIPPIVLYEDPPKVLTGEETYALAKLFSEPAVRKMLKNNINRLIKDAGTTFSDIEVQRYKQGRISALRELMAQAEVAFHKMVKTPSDISKLTSSQETMVE